MRVKINSIQNRILVSFLFVIFVSLAIYILSYFYLLRINAIRSADRDISKVETLSLNLIKADNDFFDLESINPRYFLTGKSTLLNRRDSINNLLEKQIKMVGKVTATFYNIDSNLNNIAQILIKYNQGFRELEGKVFIRGFKDYGVEGEMRKYAHALEDRIRLSNILSLRRHEKDFLLRNDQTYTELHNTLSQDILAHLKNTNAADSTIHLVEMYSQTFNELVTIQNEIGINSNEGLRSDLNQLGFQLNDQFAALSLKTSKRANELIGGILAIYIGSALLSIILALASSYFLARKLSKPIKKLSLLMKRFMAKNLKSNVPPIEFTNPTSEIENLAKSFFSLMKQTETQMQEIKSKSTQMRRKNSELKKLNDELDKFIYSTAHDLRSPLTSVLGLINLAEFDKDEKKREGYLEMMKASISKMEAFIRDVVNYSKNKKLEIEAEQVDLEALIFDVFEDHRFIPLCEKIDLRMRFEGRKTVITDPNRLRIIINNLISNAIRYSDKEKSDPYIDIEVINDEKRFKLNFADNGQGIEESHLKKIFNMFYRANEKSEGSGLGLFILKETIEVLDGGITVTSKVNEGTTFTILLPNRKRFKKTRVKKMVLT